MIKVYHNSEFLIYMVESTLSALKKGVFECVAEVETDSLDEAYRCTNNIDNPWHLNTNVKALRRENRSTSIGDLLRKDSTLYVVETEGFRELTREEECELTFHIEGGSMEKPTKSDIARQLAKELGVPCIELPLSTDDITEAFGGCSLKDGGTPPEVIEHLEDFKVLGYTVVIQFEEDGKPFGEPLAFKTHKQVSSFMWDNPKMKMVWHKKI
jgi:hypothetical protein